MTAAQAYLHDMRLCVECGMKFAGRIPYARVGSLVLGAGAIVCAMTGMALPFLFLAIGALYLTGPSACPKCKSRVNVLD
jgi:hypothetical protein